VRGTEIGSARRCWKAQAPVTRNSAKKEWFGVGHQAIIYGRIQSERATMQGRPTRTHEYNAAVLRSLPDRDEVWPFLTRHMLSLSEHRVDWDSDRGLYKSQVIHFGASLKDEPDKEDHWDKWLAKFEGLLLKKLAWISAKVHLETDFRPERVYLYRVNRESLEELLLELEQAGWPTVSEVRWDRQQFDIQEWREDWLL
jgi:hypothetical protein